MSRKFKNPLVIGALGGSGTRVVASIFIEAGVYMGDELNKSNDILAFSRLFKNSPWKATATEEEIDFRIRLFEGYMTGNAFFSEHKTDFLNLSKTNPHHKLPFFYGLRLKLRNPKPVNFWGWKEPNNQIFLEDLARNFPEMRYIQVVRNGLDMAFSKNMQQLNNWGNQFGVAVPENRDQIPKAQLEYWIRSTKDVLEKGKRLLGDRFYELNFEKLCEQPEVEVPRLLEFAGLKVEQELQNYLVTLPQKPASAGRFRNKDLSVFSKEQVAMVRELGFEVD